MEKINLNWSGAFKISYLCATNTLSTRIKISNKIQSFILPYDYEKSAYVDQALEFLEKKFNQKACYMVFNKNADYIIFDKSFNDILKG